MNESRLLFGASIFYIIKKRSDNTDKILLKQLADSCNLALGSYKKMTHEEIMEILEECF
jgi:hypothetical protein